MMNLEKWLLITKFGLLYSETMSNNPISFPSGTPFSERLLYGVRKALRKLAEETAAKGGSLVVKVDGEIKDVSAAELLKTLPEHDYTP